MNVLPNDCEVITVDSLSDMKVKLVDQAKTINKLSDEAVNLRDMVKEQKDVIEEYHDTFAELVRGLKDYKENLCKAAKVMN